MNHKNVWKGKFGKDGDEIVEKNDKDKRERKKKNTILQEIEERENIVMLMRKGNRNLLGTTNISLTSQEDSYGEDGRKEDSDNSISTAFNT